MPLNDETKDMIKGLFGEVLNILNNMDYNGDNDDAIDINEEALAFVEWFKTKTELRYGALHYNKYIKTAD